MVFSQFFEVFLGVRTDLGSGAGLDQILHQFPVFAMDFESLN